ncbi:hypothetical protein [Hymenobacter sp. 5414T-23]|uniref:hypothetical protein n=1 Tax=Hymenobacter sp. 5414T-23 TaxID=2932252 RepID=UPI001FD0F59A|nr:hypothetical protein [Hymenobacter sp. 5414T-23]UOQ81104.1 hypothetical protein MUN83_20220 [Hymenobacter sp. 5414T-23]
MQMVEPERIIGSELRVDYLLHDASGNPRLVIEAKCLGASLDKHGYVSKVLGYALGFKVQTVFITDGVQWHCYSNLHKGNTEAITFSITDDLLPAALQLIQWLDAAQSGHGISPILADETIGLAVLPAVEGINKGKLALADVLPGFIELQQLNLRQLPNQKPKQLRLPDGTIKEVKTWKDILVETSLYVLKHQPHVPIPYPDKAGKKKFLFDWYKPAPGIGYKETTLGSRPLFIYTNYSAPDCISNTIHALKLVPTTFQKIAPAVAF